MEDQEPNQEHSVACCERDVGVFFKGAGLAGSNVRLFRLSRDWQHQVDTYSTGRCWQTTTRIDSTRERIVLLVVIIIVAWLVTG